MDSHHYTPRTSVTPQSCGYMLDFRAGRRSTGCTSLRFSGLPFILVRLQDYRNSFVYGRASHAGHASQDFETVITPPLTPFELSRPF